MFLVAVQIMLSNVRAEREFTPNTIEAAGCLFNGKLAFFKS
jgi:hypothetical protein